MGRESPCAGSMAFVANNGALNETGVKRVLGQWLPLHCSGAKVIFAELLGFTVKQTTTEDHKVGPHTTTLHQLRVRVETVAGVIVARLQVSDSATVRHVKEEVEKLAPQFPAAWQRLLVWGYERHGELWDENLLKHAVHNVKATETTRRCREPSRRELEATASAEPSAQGKAISQVPPCDVGRLQNLFGGREAAVEKAATVKSVAAEAETIGNSQDELCLCVCLGTTKWRTPEVWQDLIASHNNRRISRPHDQGGYKFAFGSIRLDQPGHYFSVKIKELRPMSSCLAFSIAPKNWEPGLSALMSILCNEFGGMPTCIGVLNRRPRIDLPTVRAWQVGDEMALSLVSDETGSLLLAFAMNGETIYTVSIPDEFPPPYVPLCTLPHGCCLEMVGGLGVPLAELEKTV